MEARRERAANAESVSHMHHARDLEVGGGAEFAEVFETNRRLQRELVGDVGFEVDIHGITVLVGRRGFGEAAEAVGARREALVRQRSECPRGLVACKQVEFFLAILRAERDVKVRGKADIKPVGEGRVSDGLGLLLAAGNEVPRRVRAERGVDRVADEEIGPVRATEEAEVIAQARADTEFATQTHGNRAVLVVAAEARNEAGRNRLEEREAVGAGRDVCQEIRIREQANERNAVDAGRAAVHVADEHRGLNHTKIISCRSSS